MQIGGIRLFRNKARPDKLMIRYSIFRLLEARGDVGTMATIGEVCKARMMDELMTEMKADKVKRKFFVRVSERHSSN